jgi:hypothetical protein
LALHKTDRMKSITTSRLIIQLVFLLLIFSLSAQSQIIEYVSPRPGSRMNLPGQGIFIRSGNAIDLNTLTPELFCVRGSISGDIEGELKVLEDGQTIVFRPEKQYFPGETIKVCVRRGIRESNGAFVPELDFDFHISNKQTDKELPAFERYSSFAYESKNVHNRQKNQLMQTQSLVSLPDDFPPLFVTVDQNPSPGHYFLFSGSQNPEVASYLIILDQHGVPVFYRRSPNRGNDLKVQPNGYLTYFDFVVTRWTEIDSSYDFRRYYVADNGYTADAHELIVKPDGSYWLMIYDPQPVDMSQVVEGGDPNAIVVGLVVQHCDAGGNALFQWRSWDHMEITDCDTSWVDLTAGHIDYVHGNAISFDDFGNVLISSRKLHEITKINYNTGNIIWRWGGKRNMFQLIGDDRWFSAQHSIDYLGNNIYTLFDNGFRLEPEYSRGLVFELNETAMTATLLQTYENDPPVFAWAMGHMQTLTNGNVVLGWATNPDDYVLTEYHPDGTTAFEVLSADQSLISYRAFKFPWKQSVFEVLNDTIDFGSVDIETGNGIADLIVRNRRPDTLIINSIGISNEAFLLIDILPVKVAPDDETSIKFGFTPDMETEYEALVYLGQDKQTEFVGLSVLLKGNGILTGTGEVSKEPKIRLHPNPVSSGEELYVQIGHLEGVNALIIKDLSGKTVFFHEMTMNSGSTKVNMPDIAPGTYVVMVLSDQDAYRCLVIVD